MSGVHEASKHGKSQGQILNRDNLKPVEALEPTIRILVRSLFFIVLLLVTEATVGQPDKPVVMFSHPALKEVNRLVSTRQYQQAIDQCLKYGQQMKKVGNWEGFISFMLRAAEIETFEVWKAKSFPEIKIRFDYQRPRAYLDTLYKHGGKYIDQYPYLKGNTLFTQAVVYDWLQQPDTAEQMHLQALTLRTEQYGKDSREVADSYLWLGTLNIWGLQRKELAKLYFEKAVPLQKKYLPDSRYALGSAYYGMAIIARENFEFDEAETLANQYSTLYQDLPYEQLLGIQLIANIYWEQQNYEKSWQERRKSIKIFETFGFKEDIILEYSNLSNDLKGLNRFRESKEALKKGLKILETLPTDDPFTSKNIYENLGDLYREMGQYDSAEYFLNKALNISLKAYGKRNKEAAEVYGYRGKLFIDKNEIQAAQEDFQKMLISTIPDFNADDIFVIPPIQTENPYFLSIIGAHFNKGDAFVEWYRLEKNPKYLEHALKNYQAAYDQLMVARNAIGDELSKPLMMLQFKKSIEQSIYCGSALYEATKQPRYFQGVFQFVELTKYLNVLDALKRAERANNSGVPKNLLVQLNDVKSQLNGLQKTILSASPTAKDSLAKLNEVALNLINQRRELMAEISRHSDQTTLSVDSMLLPVNEIQAKLSADEQILEFFWGADSAYVLSITNQHTSITAIAKNSVTDSLFLSVGKFMSGTPAFGQDQIQKYSLSTNALYKKFFGPFIQKKKLTIIPDGPLSLLSAEALVVEQKTGKVSYNTLDYLIHHCEISYAYSSSILFRNASKGGRKINNVLAFSYSGGSGIPTIANRDQPVELPGTFKELEALSRLFKNVKRFTDQDASKLNFINNAAGSDIIHLGVHGIGDQEIADNSRLIFRRDSSNDAELYAYEIYNLKLDAGLVVLSACESGIGRNQAGEGMFSIARAFTYAGCPSLVMSLWQVRDVFTSELMISFYENLDQHATVSSSLRNAKLKFLEESDAYASHPANWAAFVVNGQDLSFEKSENQPLVYLTLALLIIILVTMYLRRKKRQQ